MELLGQELTAEAAAGPTAAATLLGGGGSLDRADCLPPPAAATAPTDVARIAVGPTENAGYVPFCFTNT